MGLFDIFKKKTLVVQPKTYTCARCKKEITDEETKWIGNHRFCNKCATPTKADTNAIVTSTPSTTETSEETCDIKNQSFWLLNEKYEPLPKLTLVKKGYRYIANTLGQSEIFALVRDSKNNNFLFHGSIGNYGYSFDFFSLSKTNTLPNIDTSGKVKAFLKDYYDSKQKEIPLLLSKKDYLKLSNALTYGTYGEGKCVCCGKKTSVWWRDISGTYCYECVKEKIVINNPLLENKC